MKKVINLFIIIVLVLPFSVRSQTIHQTLDRIKTAYDNKNLYSALNLCREILILCEENPESECYYTNVMKDVYYYKGLVEYEIYKKELKLKRLENSIQSFEKSYDMYKNAEVLYLFGYLSAFRFAMLGKIDKLDGLVNAWRGILELYGHNNWKINLELLGKIKDFLTLAERYAISKDQSNYTGKFAGFMIVMACNLADKAELSNIDQKFFDKYRHKYSSN